MNETPTENTKSGVDNNTLDDTKPIRTNAQYADKGSSGVYDLMRVVLDRALPSAETKALLDEVRKVAPASDRWTFRYAIWILGSVVIFSIFGMIALTFWDKKVPEGLVSIGSAAAGGLAGLLTPKGSSN